MASKSTQALLSWGLDALSSLLVLGLLAAWLADLQHPDNPTYLSKSFVEDGFCLSHRFDNTHTSCSILDFGDAAYFLAHGYGHWEIGRSGVQAKRGMGLIDTVGLAIILSIGPIVMAASLVEAKKLRKSKAEALAALVLVSLVAIYNMRIQNPTYALLYINISIMLCVTAPRALIVGFRSEEDVQLRASKFHWPGILSSVFILAVIICEPFFCEHFVSSFGGHFVFDASLALDVLVKMVKEHGGGKSGAEKLKTK